MRVRRRDLQAILIWIWERVRGAVAFGLDVRSLKLVSVDLTSTLDGRPIDDSLWQVYAEFFSTPGLQRIVALDSLWSFEARDLPAGVYSAYLLRDPDYVPNDLETVEYRARVTYGIRVVKDSAAVVLLYVSCQDLVECPYWPIPWEEEYGPL